MPEIIARTSSKSYGITVSTGCIGRTGEVFRSCVKGNKAFIVTDKNVERLYLERVEKSLKALDIETMHYSIEPGEESKNQEELFILYNKFHDFSLTRSDGIIALGGGVPGDLAGFAAATYLRGIPLISIPTTLLAQVDSSVGGKTAIDMPFGKNMVGAFYHPEAVLIDPGVLATLPREVMYDGIAEVIKYGCIRDRKLFESIESGRLDLEWMIERCIKIKVGIVADDELDKGERMLLNFGHTTGHAIEKLSGYKDMTHGQAVAAGMVIAAGIGEKLKITKPGTCDRITKCLERFRLPVSSGYKADELTEVMQSDKKNLSGKLYFVLLSDIGEGIIYPVKKQELNQILKEVL